MGGTQAKGGALYDLVISGGDVLTFGPEGLRKNCSLGIEGGIIREIAPGPLNGRRVIDGRGLTVLPGFIDFHSHVDGNLFSAGCLLRQGATTTIGGERNFDGAVIRRIAENGFPINHGFYISHSFTLRKAAGIEDPYRPATAAEIQTMVLLAE